MQEQPAAADILSTPLGQKRKPKRRFAVPGAVPVVAAATLAAIPAVFLAWVVMVDDPLGGEPVAIVSTKAAPAADPAKAGGGSQTAAAPAAGDKAVVVTPGASEPQNADGQTITIIDGMSGKRRQVTITPASTGLGVVPAAAPAAQQPISPPAPPENKVAPAPDEKMLEKSRHGAIPKIAPDGKRPSEAYAAQNATPARPGAARVAIVVGRLGVSASLTTEALAKLPAPVTLAFTPYGADLDRWAARARGEGHEVLLQAPMEPFDYPDNDPGPQTLLMSLSADQNVDRLHWSMSRFQGYVGIGNYMGARLSSNEAAMMAVMREAAKRGLIYFDDGAAARGLAAQTAGASNVAFARADLVIDATPTAAEIDATLTRLENLARERGIAVGSASALPISVDRIAQWAKAAEARGIVLVPISAAASRPRSS